MHVIHLSVLQALPAWSCPLFGCTEASVVLRVPDEIIDPRVFSGSIHQTFSKSQSPPTPRRYTVMI